MNSYNLIVKCDKCSMPEHDMLEEFVKNLFVDSEIDYFGDEIDNQMDFIDEHVKYLLDSKTYLTFRFSHMDKLDRQKAYEYVKDRLDQAESFEVRVDDKDIEVILHG